MDHSHQVYLKTVKVLEALQGVHCGQVEEFGEVLKPLKIIIESENEQLLMINQRISFLSEILALKKQVNLVSETRLKVLEESGQAFEKELGESKSRPISVPKANFINVESINEEISQEEEKYDLLSECLSQQLCLNCLSKVCNFE